ncbi:hypothetical protein EJD97_011407 [Solanum chilense]|uniref:MULE transposase domain-containing protein n=1 Tax=Solanum chilense TaxID=4083 RepID=A0A6N2BF07_SOLCI|nr:hypothetical protein EJD97_011407 [Solanum chilense]
MKASTLNKSNLFKVRKYNAQHTCFVRDRVYARRQGITDVVAVLIMEKYIDPSTVYTPKDISADMLKLHRVSLTYIQAWRAREKAIKLVRGDPAKSYARLPGYLYILEQTYPGSILKIERKGSDKFLYAFVALEACIRVRQNMCFMSDRNESIWKGTATVYPESEHYACIWHFKWSRAYSNCKRTWTMTSNIAESLNNVNRLARRLPVISLLEFMMITIQRWIHKHNEEADKTTSDLTKKYNLYLQKSIALSCNKKVIPSTVDLHAIVERANLKNFRDAYAIPVEPIPCESTWNLPSYISEPKMLPLGPKRTTGRPKLERWKVFADVKFKRTKMTCSSCR